MATAALIIGTGVSIVGGFLQYNAARREAAAREDQAKLTALHQRQQSDLESGARRRDAIKQAMLNQAQAQVALASTGGTPGTSSAYGGASGQAANTLGNTLQTTNAANFIAGREGQQQWTNAGRIAKAQQQGAFGGFLGNVGAGITNLA